MFSLRSYPSKLRIGLITYKSIQLTADTTRKPINTPNPENIAHEESRLRQPRRRGPDARRVPPPIAHHLGDFSGRGGRVLELGDLSADGRPPHVLHVIPSLRHGHHPLLHLAEGEGADRWRGAEEGLSLRVFRLALLRSPRDADLHQHLPGLGVSGGDVDGQRPGSGSGGGGRHQSDGWVIEIDRRAPK